MKHFSELTNNEVKTLTNAAIDATIEQAQKLGMSGLSELGSHNLYKAIQGAVQCEYERAKNAKKRSIYEDCCPDCSCITQPEIVYPAKGRLRALYVCDHCVNGWNTWFAKEYADFIYNL